MVGLHHLAFSSLLLASPIAALYKANGHVQMLNSKNYETALAAVHKTAIIEFFAPWCGHCQKLAKDYETAAKDLRGFADVFAVDCEDEASKELCQKQGIKGFPTLKLIKPNEKSGKKPLIREYTGGRKIKDIVTAVLDGLPSNIKRLTIDDFEEFLEHRNDTAKTLLFSDKGTTPGLYKALKIDFGDRVEMAMIRDKEKEVLEYFGVKQVPTFIYLPGGKADGVVFAEKKMDREHVYNWIKKWVDPVIDPHLTAIQRSKVLKGEKAEKKAEKKKEVKTEEKPKEAEKPKESAPAAEPEMIWLIPALADVTAIQQACFTPKSKTCILGISEAVDTLDDPSIAGFKATHDFYRVHHKGVARFYKLGSNSEAGKWVREQLGLGSDKTVVAVNGHRGWFRVYNGKNEASEVEGWVDEIRLGDASKEKLPEGLIVEVSTDEPLISEEKHKEEFKEPEAAEPKKEEHDEL